VVKYGPFVEEQLGSIEQDFKELAKGTHLEDVALSYVARRGGGICNTCGSKRNFLHTWELCSNCGSPGVCVDYDPVKQLRVVSVDFID